MYGIMSDSENLVVCSQVSVRGYDDIQSSGYGGDVIDGVGEGMERVVSLEGGDVPVFETENCKVTCQNEWILYDNILIEDISSDVEIDRM